MAMVRNDNYKPKEYYERKLEDLNRELRLFWDKFELGKIKDLNKCYIYINNYTYRKIHIEYMLGKDRESIKETAIQYIDQMSAYAVLSKSELDYNDIIRTLSLSVIFNVDKVDFIRDKMISEKYVDAICDLLRNKIFSNTVLNTKSFYFQEKGYFGDEYKKSEDELLQAINAKNQEIRRKLFLEYIDTTKEKYHYKLLSFYDKHDEDQYIYLGSYDFTLTAIAKILRIEIQYLKSSKYIAYDLL